MANKHVASPVWEFIAEEVARLLHDHPNPTILDLASGPAEPACSIAKLHPTAKVICTDIDKDLLADARQRVKKSGLSSRVKVKHLDMRDLSSVANASLDAVTICLGLHLIPEEIQRVLDEISRVLAHGGYLIATVWDKIPMVDCCCRTMEQLTGEPGSSFLPEDPFRFAGGRMDPLLEHSNFTLVNSHGRILPVTINAGHADSEKAWRTGPLAILPRLVLSPPRELQAFKSALRRTCEAEGLLNSLEEVCMTQLCRLIAVQKKASPPAQEESARQQARQQTNHQQGSQPSRDELKQRLHAARRNAGQPRRQQDAHAMDVAARVDQAKLRLEEAKARAAASQNPEPAESAGGLLRLLATGNDANSTRWTFARGTPDNLAIVESDIDVAAHKFATAVRNALVHDTVDDELTAHLIGMRWDDPESTHGRFSQVLRRPLVLTPEACAVLRAAVDAKVDETYDTVDHFAQHVLTLNLAELRGLVGAEAVETLTSLPEQMLRERWETAHARAQVAARTVQEGDPVTVTVQEGDKTWLSDALKEARSSAAAMSSDQAGARITVHTFIRRYTRHTRPWLGFHTDRSFATVNIALSADSSFEGGRLHAILGGRHCVVEREEGEATVHGDDVMHAVSAMREGARYTLVMLFFKGSVGSKGVDEWRSELV
jgi:SAM-dependent methyltransferase